MGAGLTRGVEVPPAAVPYSAPLVTGTFLRRYKRFFADVRLADGTEVVAHCPNTGSMMGLDRPGAPCRVSHDPSPRRKLAWTLEQVAVDDTWVMVHTGRPNRVVEAAILAGALPSLRGYDRVLRERPYGERSRIDLLLLDGGDLLPGAAPEVRRGRALVPAQRACFVEVKNVTLVRDGVAAFPDAVSTRGARHLDELAAMVAAGHRAALVLHVARADARAFTAARDVDPAWGEALDRAAAAGVEVLPIACEVGEDALRLGAHLPWVDAEGLRARGAPT